MKKVPRAVRAGALVIGGGRPVSVQGMTKVRTADYRSALAQLRALEEAGAELVRLAVRDEADLAAFSRLRAETTLPLAADIHFRASLALGALSAGADKLRLNPGNIRDPGKLRAIIDLAGEKGAAIRVGVNSGSLPPAARENPGRRPAASPSAAEKRLAHRMVEVAGQYLELFEKRRFRAVVVSLKASSVPVFLRANRLFRKNFDYPLHLGVTEAGRGVPALVKSALGIGILLEEGLGDTIRVSLSQPPADEIHAGRHILQALGRRRFYPEIISCPTCGRCRAPLFACLDEVESRLARLPGWPEKYAHLKIAVMGCEVNGPGEAREADLGVAAGARMGLLFVRGRRPEPVPVPELAERLMAELCRLVGAGQK